MSEKVVIIGAGEVGYNLALRFAREDYDITVVDIDPEKCRIVKSTVDANVIEGDGASQRILQQINMPEIDIFLALSRIDEVNLVSSRIAKRMGARKVISRLRNTEYQHPNAVVTPGQFGIDFVTYPEKAAKKEIELLIRQPASSELKGFADGKIILMGLKLEGSSPLVGRTAQNVELSNPFIRHKLVVVVREEKTFIPHQDTKYRKDDIIFMVGNSRDMKQIQVMCGRPVMDNRNILILGAGKMGRLLAKALENDYDIRIIEKDKEKAERAGLKLPNTLILNDNGTNIELLESERIHEVDCFIAVTDSEQTNILSSVLAKHLGVKQVITHITTSAYIPAVRRIGVDAVVSKNIAAVNEVINFLKSDGAVSISRFDELGIEAVELKVQANCKYIRKKMTLEKIPATISFGALVRNDTVEIPNPHTIIQQDDTLLLFTKPENIGLTERLFI